MVVVDTTVWLDYLRGARTLQVDWLESQIGQQRMGLTDIILCEILQGISEDKHFEAMRKELSKFEIFSTGGIELAVTTARNYRTLRSKGYTVRKTIDCLIATFCLINGHSLLHNDRDFDAFEEILGLKVIHP